jgi:hypothetical protein
MGLTSQTRCNTLKKQGGKEERRLSDKVATLGWHGQPFPQIFPKSPFAHGPDRSTRLAIPRFLTFGDQQRL